MSGVRRVYVEKKEPFAVAARQLKDDIEGFLGISAIRDVRILIRYDVENISDETFERGCRTVFSEPPVDVLYRETIEIPAGTKVFSVEALPGQFDQRADSAEQCLQFLKEDEKPVVRTAVIPSSQIQFIVYYSFVHYLILRFTRVIGRILHGKFLAEYVCIFHEWERLYG